MSRAHPPLRTPSPQPAHRPADPATRASPLHLVVDLNRCQGYAQCCFLAPDVFTLHGEEALWYDPAPDEAQRQRVLQAALACPVQAISMQAPEIASRAHGKHTERHEHGEVPRAAQRP